MEPKKIAESLISLTSDGRYIDAIAAYYSDDVVSIEPKAADGIPVETHGIDEIRAKSVRWLEEREIHDLKTGDWSVDGDRFSVVYDIDFTLKNGPNAGKRSHQRQLGIYTTRHGKIVREELIY